MVFKEVAPESLGVPEYLVELSVAAPPTTCLFCLLPPRPAGGVQGGGAHRRPLRGGQDPPELPAGIRQGAPRRAAPRRAASCCAVPCCAALCCAAPRRAVVPSIGTAFVLENGRGMLAAAAQRKSRVCVGSAGAQQGPAAAQRRKKEESSLPPACSQPNAGRGAPARAGRRHLCHPLLPHTLQQRGGGPGPSFLAIFGCIPPSMRARLCPQLAGLFMFTSPFHARRVRHRPVWQAGLARLGAAQLPRARGRLRASFSGNTIH